jgi:hypothetical protein
MGTSFIGYQDDDCVVCETNPLQASATRERSRALTLVLAYRPQRTALCRMMPMSCPLSL